MVALNYQGYTVVSDFLLVFCSDLGLSHWSHQTIIPKKKNNLSEHRKVSVSTTIRTTRGFYDTEMTCILWSKHQLINIMQCVMLWCFIINIGYFCYYYLHFNFMCGMIVVSRHQSISCCCLCLLLLLCAIVSLYYAVVICHPQWLKDWCGECYMLTSLGHLI